MTIKWETTSKEEKKKLDDLTELTGLIRRQLAAYLKTPSEMADKHVFAEEIRKLGNEIINWVDDYEARI